MQKGGLTVKKYIVLGILMLLLYGVTAFVYEHCLGYSMRRDYVLWSAAQGLFFGVGMGLWLLIDIHVQDYVKQKKISKWLLIAMTVFMLLLVCEWNWVLDISVLENKFCFWIFEIPKTYIYEILMVLLYPAMAIYIVKAIGPERITSSKAKTAYWQIALVTILEFALCMCLPGVWILELLVFNFVALVIAVNHSEFGKNINKGDKIGLFIVYGILLFCLLLVYSQNYTWDVNGYFYNHSWKTEQHCIGKIVREASWVGQSRLLQASEEIKVFIGENPEKILLYLLFYGGWLPVFCYFGVLIGFLYLLYQGLCPKTRKLNDAYPVYLVAFAELFFRSVFGTLGGLGVLPLPFNLPFSTEFGVIMDTFCVGLLLISGLLNNWIYCNEDGSNTVAAWLDDDDEFWFEDEEEEFEENMEEIDGEELEQLLKEAEQDYKASVFLKVITGIAVVVLIFVLWHCSLEWLQSNIPKLNTYEATEIYWEPESANEEGLLLL